MRPTFPAYALLLARAAATRSEDPERKVGAVVLRADMTVAGVGYNGAPSKMTIDWNDPLAVDRAAIHAESNALRLTVPLDVRGGLLASTLSPCVDCLKLVAAYGITQVWYIEQAGESHWDNTIAAKLLGIEFNQWCPNA